MISRALSVLAGLLLAVGLSGTAHAGGGGGGSTCGSGTWNRTVHPVPANLATVCDSGKRFQGTTDTDLTTELGQLDQLYLVQKGCTNVFAHNSDRVYRCAGQKDVTVVGALTDKPGGGLLTWITLLES